MQAQLYPKYDGWPKYHDIGLVQAYTNVLSLYGLCKSKLRSYVCFACSRYTKPIAGSLWTNTPDCGTFLTLQNQRYWTNRLWRAYGSTINHKTSEALTTIYWHENPMLRVARCTACNVPVLLALAMQVWARQYPGCFSRVSSWLLPRLSWVLQLLPIVEILGCAAGVITMLISPIR